MKATEYRLELCDNSGQHRPIAIIKSATPFMPVSIGDRFDDEGWPRLDCGGRRGTPEMPHRYLVHSIKHVVVEELDNIVVRYCLNLTPFDGERSPVWGGSPPVRHDAKG